MRLFPILVLCATPLAAETSFPSWTYFDGIYERTGRGPGDQPALFNDQVQIARAPDWESLRLTPCAGAGEDLAYPMTFYRELQAEVPNSLRAAYWREELLCEFYNDGGNTPLIHCMGGEGTRMTFHMLTSDLEGPQAATCAVE